MIRGEEVFVTGYGARRAFGSGRDAFSRNVFPASVAFRLVDRFDASPYWTDLPALDTVAISQRQAPVPAALSNSFAFGGRNVSLVFAARRSCSADAARRSCSADAARRSRSADAARRSCSADTER
jgi:hypothetical protein